jgi:WD40 repeat protein
LRATVEAEPGATAGLTEVQPARADAAAVEWRQTRYWRWQEEQQHAEPGLRPALLRLALASLLQPRLAADARVGTAELPGDVVGVVGAAVESALRFCGVLTGHTDWVFSAAFSPDGLKVVSGGGNSYDSSGDKSVRIWSAMTGECEHTMKGHTKTVYSVAFSQEGRQIVSASSDKTVRVWDAAMGESQQTLTGHTSDVTSARFSPDGLKIVSASLDKTVRIWSVATAECLQTLVGHTKAVLSAAFSLDGLKIVSGGDDRTV